MEGGVIIDIRNNTQREKLAAHTESIEWFIEDRALSQSYDLAPSSNSLPSASCLSLPVCVAGQAYWREREGGGRGVKSIARKPGPLWTIQYSLGPPRNVVRDKFINSWKKTAADPADNTLQLEQGTSNGSWSCCPYLTVRAGNIKWQLILLTIPYS